MPADRGPLEAVLFDWGGTLSTYLPVDLLAMWRAAAQVLAPTDPEPLAAALLAAEDRWWAEATAHGDRSGTSEQIVRSVSLDVGVDVSAAVAAYHGAWEHTVAHDPDAGPVLRALRDRGLRTGLLSNTHWPRALHERWLAQAGLLELLDARVYTSDLAHVKPHPQAFAALLTAVGVPAQRAAFVGDRPYDDVHGAQRCGLRGVLLAGRPVPGHDVEPDAVIASLPELLEVVDRWRSTRS